jgi:hypothetical protein
MVVSRFLKFPIQNNLSENQCAHGNPLSHIFNPSGPGGYMKRAKVLKRAKPLSPIFSERKNTKKGF